MNWDGHSVSNALNRARTEIKELLTAKANVDLILGVGSEEIKREKSQGR